MTKPPIPTENSKTKGMRVWNAKKVEDDEWQSCLQIQTSSSSIINFRYPYVVLKMTATEQGPLAIICKLLLEIQIYPK